MEFAVRLQSKLNEKHDGSIFQSCKIFMKNVENLVTVWNSLVAGEHTKYQIMSFDRRIIAVHRSKVNLKNTFKSQIRYWSFWFNNNN